MAQDLTDPYTYMIIYTENNKLPSEHHNLTFQNKQ